MYIFILTITMLIFISLRQRIINQKRYSNKANIDLPIESISSPFSRALTELMGLAGGIYLSLIMLVNFLSLEIPSKVEILRVGIDPLALTSIIISIIQPFIKKSV